MGKLAKIIGVVVVVGAIVATLVGIFGNVTAIEAIINTVIDMISPGNSVNFRF